ncbi:MAG: nitrate reductase cytochrome c-type subunit [Burkholderiaceae bacterium]
MKRTLILGSIVALLATVGIGGQLAAQQQSEVTSLRGERIDQSKPVDQIYKQKEGRQVRNYRQQPPLIPHSISQYQIDLRANQCLGCHDWTNASDRAAPTLSMTHYQDRDGNQLDKVAGTRWFCNQCHVPQANAPELVENLFKPGR